MNSLVNTNEIRMNHVELCELINKLRSEEGRRILDKSDFLKKVKKEIKTMQILGLEDDGNFSVVEYKDKKGEMRPTISMNKDGILQMCASESVYVRVKMVEYIKALEKKLKEQTLPSYQIEDKIKRAETWIKEETERQQLYLENQELKQEIEELEEYKMFKSMINNCTDSDMLLGKFGVFLKSNTPIKTGRNMIFGFCKQNGLVINQYKENYASDYAVRNGYLKNVGEYANTKYGIQLCNKIYITKKGCLFIGEKLFRKYLEDNID